MIPGSPVAPRTHAAHIRRIVFDPPVGPMAPRYLRALGFRPGQDASRAQLVRGEQRLGHLPGVATASVEVSDGRATVHLVEVPVPLYALTPLPFLSSLAAGAGLQDWKVRGQYLDLAVAFGFDWDLRALYDPNLRAPRLFSTLTPTVAPLGIFQDDYLFVSARAGLLVAPYTRVFLGASASGLASTFQALTPFGGLSAAFDPVGIPGAVWVLGPEVSYDDTDDPDFPRSGTAAFASVAFGAKALGDPGDFTRYRVDGARYFPLRTRETLAIGLEAGYARGDVPWLYQLTTGGSSLPSEPWDRFIGDEQLTVTAEYRNLFAPQLPFLTFLTPWVPVGLAWTGFVDAGRGWSSSYGVPFPQDVREGGGLGLVLMLWGGPIGTLDAAYGNDGFFATTTSGFNF